MARAGTTPLWRVICLATALAAILVIWAAFPLATGRGGTRLALIAAVVMAVLSSAQLAVSQVRGLQAGQLNPWHERAADSLLGFLRAAPWAEGMLLAVLVLEALHGARAWHTAVLGVGLLGYLFAVHLGETRASVSALRPQIPLIAAGLGLLALAVGAAALPAMPSGSASSLVRVIAISAAVVAAAIAVPAVTSSRR